MIFWALGIAAMIVQHGILGYCALTGANGTGFARAYLIFGFLSFTLMVLACLSLL